jgi:hypothetical protein
MRTIFGSSVLWIGVALLVIGYSPLFLSVVYYAVWHPNLNPVLVPQALLAWLAFWPSMILVVIGLGLGIARYFGWID